MKKEIINKSAVYLNIKGHKSDYILPDNNIMFCKANSAYTHLHIADGKIITWCKPLKKVEAELSACKNFCRIHKSYLANLLYVEKIIHEPKPAVVFKNGAILNISFRKKGLLNKSLKNFYRK